jgi:hypothetical protein
MSTGLKTSDEIMGEAIALLLAATNLRVAELRARPGSLARRQGQDPDRYYLTGNRSDYNRLLRQPDMIAIRARWVSAVKAERGAKDMDPALDVDSYFPDELARADALARIDGAMG